MPPLPESPVEGRLRVLLGDETDAEQPWHRNARELLKAQGIDSLVARDGRDALGLIEKSAVGEGPKIHVCVLEQKMAGMGAIQILRRLAAELEDEAQAGKVALPPSILLADATPRVSGLMHDALTARVFSVLPKPVELNLLLDTLARALRRFYQNKWPDGENPS
ncbi:MAG: hypothetical protein AAGK78_07530 [Planctomycetota bacterium]